jgi:phospholipid transport system substrate-binding protein
MMYVKKPILLVSTLVLLAVATVVSAVPRPTTQLQETVDRIIEVLRDKELSQEQILQEVADLVRQKFDFWAMSQRTLGVNWRKATKEEQQKFVGLFAKLLEDTYRGRIKAYTYDDEHVEYIGERVRGTRAEVDTIVVANKEIPVSYKMRLKGEEWLVYDVIVEEVSLISNYRNSYAEIVRDEGFKGLLERMEKKIQELAETNEQAGGGESAPQTEGSKAP